VNEPSVTVRYTVEELAVLAELLEAESLPGCPPASLSTSTRSLATRSLIARNIVSLPVGGAVELLEPHASLIKILFDATEIVQFVHHAGDTASTEQWFVTDDGTVRVSALEEALDGIVSFAWYPGRVAPPVGAALADVDPSSLPRRFDEVIHLERAAGRTSAEHHLAESS
jgi:hypothetical protein